MTGAKTPNSLLEQLFDEFVEAREKGREPDVDDLLRRAAGDAERLAARIEDYRALEGIGQILRAPSAEAEPAPTELGRYSILRSLGRGGFSQSVYLARDTVLQREVALKVFPPQRLPDPAQRAIVLAEARSLAVLDHEDVVRVHDSGEIEGHAYIDMELVDGPSLRAVLKATREGRHDDERTQRLAADLGSLASRCELGARLARGLGACHTRGVIHRDVKPENVLLREDGAPVLIDFGLAHLAPGSSEDGQSDSGFTEVLAGTSEYLAPEQLTVRRTGASTRTDVWSLGVVLFELIAGEHPFRRGSPSETEHAIETEPPPPLRRLVPRADPKLERVLRHCLEKDPDRRYVSMEALADDLVACVEGRPISLAPPTLSQVAGLWLRRHRRRVAVASTLLLAAGALLVGTLWVGARRSVRDLRAEFHALLEQRLPQLLQPDDAVQAWSEIRSWKGGVLQLARSPISALASRGLGREVDAAATELSRTMHGVIDGQRGFFDRLEVGYDFAPWGTALVLEEQITGDCTSGWQEHHDRLLTWFPPLAADHGWHWEVQRIVTPLAPERPNPPLFLPLHSGWAGAAPEGTEVLRLSTGLYRLVFREHPTGPVKIELETIVDAVAEQRALHGRPVDSRLADVLLEVACTEEEVQDWLDSEHFTGERSSAFGSADLFGVASYRIAPNPVTWGELEVFLGEHAEEIGPLALEFTLELNAGRQAGDDALVPGWYVADAYARNRGARLPTVVELRFAGEAVGALSLRKASTGAVAEWTSSLTQENDAACIVALEEDEAKPRSIAFPWSISWPRRVLSGGEKYRFRLALSGDPLPR